MYSLVIISALWNRDDSDIFCSTNNASELLVWKRKEAAPIFYACCLRNLKSAFWILNQKDKNLGSW